jgi:hypothetical protein
VIPAGGSGQLKAKITLKPGQTGAISKTIMVYTDAAERRPLRLRLKVQPVTPVTVLPRMYAHVRASVGETVTESLLVRRGDGKKLEITEVTVLPSDTLDVSWRPVDVEEDPPVHGMAGREGDIRVDLALPAGAPAGRRNGTLTFVTNHPDAPKMEVPFVSIVRPRIEPRPSEVRLRAAPAGRAGRQVELRLASTVGVPFSIRGIEVSDPELLEAEILPGGDGQLHHRLMVGLTAEPETDTIEKEVRGWLRVATNDDAAPVVEIPVVVSPDPARVRTGRAADLPSGAARIP